MPFYPEIHESFKQKQKQKSKTNQRNRLVTEKNVFKFSISTLISMQSASPVSLRLKVL